MSKRQVIVMDITFSSNYDELSATDLMKLLLDKRTNVKNISIKVTNKRREE